MSPNIHLTEILTLLIALLIILPSGDLAPLYGRVSVGEPLEGMHDLHTDREFPLL